MSKSAKKKGDEPPKSVLMGRVGTNLKIGIVGLPNVGKSTFFNVLTKSQVPAENFPYCTIKPHESRVAVPDPRFDWLVQHHKPMSQVPAHLNVVDIAGLIKGASENAGLGNAFLSDIKGTDAIFHLIRVFDDEDVIHVAGEVDPVRDLETISDELRLKDVEYVEKEYEKLEKLAVRGNDKSKRAAFDTFTKVKDVLINEKKSVRFNNWSGNEIEILNDHLLITSKPIIYLVNLSERHYIKKKNKWLIKIKEWVDANDPGAPIIPFSADFEQRWSEMTDDERIQFEDENNGTTTVLPKIIKQGYSTLNLQYFFTCGKDEVKAWTVQKGFKAPQAAGKIHTDMEKGFIMAEVMCYEEFKELGSEAAMKNAGKYKMKGRDYVVEDGDIIFFKFNTPTAAKKK